MGVVELVERFLSVVMITNQGKKTVKNEKEYRLLNTREEERIRSKLPFANCTFIRKAHLKFQVIS